MSVPLIQEGDHVIIKKEKNMKTIQIRRKRKIWMEKSNFSVGGAIGQPYGSLFQVQRGELVKVDRQAMEEDSEQTSGLDNRNLHDSDANQKLSKDEIDEMRKKGMSGETIVETLIENSATFKGKTEFAQQKYIKKKKKKYLAIFTILKPSTRLLSEMYFSRGPLKICNLRMDSLSQVLSQANISAHSRVMVVETVSGLLLGSVMERIGGFGQVVHLFTGSSPSRPAIGAYGFSKDVQKSLYTFPLNLVGTLNESNSNTANGSGTLNTESTEPKVAQETETETKMETSISEQTIQSEPVDMSLPEPTEGESSEQILSKDADESRNNSDAEDTAKDPQKQLGKRKLTQEERDQRRQDRLRQEAEAREILQKGNLDSLIVACKFNPTPIVLKLIDLLAPSRPVVVFSQYQEPLMDCYVKLREVGGVVGLQISETWLREYQVLPSRTHPLINMSGGGGFILCGTTVAR